MIQLPPRTRWNIRISNTASAGRLGSKPPCAQCRPSVATNKPLLRTATRSPGRGSSSLALPPVRASRQRPETLRHGRFAYLPRESLKRVRAARAMISPARREKPCISTVAGGVLGKGQWLFATLFLGWRWLLRLIHRTSSPHPRNSGNHVPFRTERDASAPGKEPATKKKERASPFLLGPQLMGGTNGGTVLISSPPL
jgi:hypothetical protein